MVAQVYVLLLTRFTYLSIHLINALSFNCYVCYQMIYISYSEYLYSRSWLYMYKVCQRIKKIYKAEINWSSLLIYGDLNYYYNVIYQPSLFAHINSRYHAFKAEVLKDSHCETAQFWARYMYIIQTVFTLIRATRKTSVNCMSALSVCLVPNFIAHNHNKYAQYVPV